MEKIPTAKELIETDYYHLHLDTDSICLGSIETAMIEFAKLHVEVMMKDMEQKLLDTLDDHQYLEENVCGVIEEIREYKSDNIK
jgi:hypothetical protein